MGEQAGRNWDTERRLADLEADGIVAEVIYPNTIPPFYPEPSLKAQVPGANEGDLAPPLGGPAGPQPLAGRLLRGGPGAPGRHRPDHAARRRRRGGRDGVGGRGGDDGGGILLPGTPPGSGLEPLYSRRYEPIWDACEAAGLPVNHHSGSAVPAMGDEPIDQVIFMLEVTWWAHRALWHLIFGGVLERHPDLQFVFTEQGTAWIPETLGTLDYFFDRMDQAAGVPGVRVGQPGGPQAVAPAQRVLGPPVPRRIELHASGRRRRCATRSGSTGSCGVATTPTRRPASRSAARRCG